MLMILYINMYYGYLFEHFLPFSIAEFSRFLYLDLRWRTLARCYVLML
jgi:hypothetical protein